jgi:hypothetical protein
MLVNESSYQRAMGGTISNDSCYGYYAMSQLCKRRASCSRKEIWNESREDICVRMYEYCSFEEVAQVGEIDWIDVAVNRRWDGFTKEEHSGTEEFSSFSGDKRQCIRRRPRGLGR